MICPVKITSEVSALSCGLKEASYVLRSIGRWTVHCRPDGLKPLGNSSKGDSDIRNWRESPRALQFDEDPEAEKELHFDIFSTDGSEDHGQILRSWRPAFTPTSKT